MMLKDRGGAFVAQRSDIIACEQEIFEGAKIISEDQPTQYFLKILDKQ